MSYTIFLSRKADKQYNTLDHHIQDKIKSIFLELKEDPQKGISLVGEKYAGLQYIKTKYKGTE
ncbi:MAG: type II toxin-antitoxin system RelE family toxin [bacterium]